MKKLITGIIAVAVLAGIGFYQYNKMAAASVVKYEAPKTVEKEVTVDELNKRINDALEASSTEIETKAKNAYIAAEHQAQVEIELAVTSAYRAEVEKKEKALQKESVLY